MTWPRSLALFSLAAALSAQAPGPPAAQLAEMKKLDFLVGQWQGAGWMEFGPGQRREFTGAENVETKAGGWRCWSSPHGRRGQIGGPSPMPGWWGSGAAQSAHHRRPGQWLETGDASRDGSTWRKFFEMKLARVSR